MIPEASAGIIGVTFFGALAGPTVFSTVTGLTGMLAPAFLILSALGVVGVVMLFLTAASEGGHA
jgi:hypothetical protein